MRALILDGLVLAPPIQHSQAAFIARLSAASARGFAVAATASHVEGRGAGHTKTNPATTQLTTLDVDYRSTGHVDGTLRQDRFQQTCGNFTTL
jgi:hypothetical protein